MGCKSSKQKILPKKSFVSSINEISMLGQEMLANELILESAHDKLNNAKLKLKSMHLMKSV
jgi:hypothetical protein